MAVVAHEVAECEPDGGEGLLGDVGGVEPGVLAGVAGPAAGLLDDGLRKGDGSDPIGCGAVLGWSLGWHKQWALR